MSDLIIQLSQWLLTLTQGAEPWDSYARYLPRLMDGVWITLQLVLLSGVIGFLMAVPLALMRISKNPWLWVFPYCYIFFFRGTPLLVQIFLVYYGLSQFESLRNLGWIWTDVLSQPYWCAIIAFSLNTSAYIAELFRGAIQAVPKGETEAAQALGMSQRQQYQYVILPRAFGIILPAYGNEVILMLKGSALASTITLLDLMGATRGAISRTYLSLEFFLLAGFIYLILTAVLIGFFRLLENLFNAHQRAQDMKINNLDPQIKDKHLEDSVR